MNEDYEAGWDGCEFSMISKGYDGYLDWLRNLLWAKVRLP